MNDLPTPEAMGQILDATIHAKQCEKVLRAYADGRLIDLNDIIKEMSHGTIRFTRTPGNLIAVPGSMIGGIDSGRWYRLIPFGGSDEDSAVEEHRRNRAVVFDRIDKGAGIGGDGDE